MSNKQFSINPLETTITDIGTTDNTLGKYKSYQENVVRPLENKNAKHSKDIVGKVIAVALVAFLVCGYFYS